MNKKEREFIYVKEKNYEGAKKLILAALEILDDIVSTFESLDESQDTPPEISQPSLVESHEREVWQMIRIRALKHYDNNLRDKEDKEN